MPDLFLETSARDCRSCTKCPDLVTSRTRIVYPTKAHEDGLLVIGEAPGAKEDELGQGFVGTAGVTLDRLLSLQNISRDSYSRANICRCRPLDNRKPGNEEINNCLPYLAEFIAEVRPRVILTVGATPTRVFWGTGNLYDKILARPDDYAVKKCYNTAHELIKPVLQFTQFVVPTPHTSPLAFNRNAPSGQKWAVIAARQIAIAASLLR